MFQGTEVKAITYSAMKIYQDPEKGRCEVFVIIDI
jgi:SHS2 domain-containing protein